MSRPKLLLADDSVTIRKVVELTFADEGIDVSAVADADAAMAKFVEIQPDVVLVDVSLASTSGYKICEMIKQDDATRHIPVLLLVGSFEPFDQDEAERVQADGFLTKPFHSIRDLVARVWDLLGRRNERPDAGIVELSLSHETVPELQDIDSLYRNSLPGTSKPEEYDAIDDLLGGPGMDDEMIEASYPGPVFYDETETVQSGERAKEFDWSPESLVTESTAESMKPAFEPRFVFDDSEDVGSLADTQTRNDGADATVIDSTTTQTQNHENDFEIFARVSDSSSKSIEPAPELIDAIVRRVVDRLSDSAVREIAQEAVPRIAEKLIREALEEKTKA